MLSLIINMDYIHTQKIHNNNFNVLVNAKIINSIIMMNNYHNKMDKIFINVLKNVKMDNIIDNLKVLAITNAQIHVKMINL